MKIKYFRKITNVIEDESGQFAIIFALCLLPLFGFVGAVVDYSQAKNAEQKVQAALDTAVMAAAIAKQNSDSDSTAEDQAENVFGANNSARATVSNFEITFDNTAGTVSGVVQAAIETSILGIFGYSELNFTKTAISKYSNTELPMDLAIMLDVSGSMNKGGRLNGLKRAVKGLLEEIIGSGSTSDTVRVAFAPFSTSVNAGIYADNLIGDSSSNNCVAERSGRDAYTDAAPRDNMFDVDGSYAISKDENDGVYREASFDGYPVSGLDTLDVTTLCSDSEIQPLTGDYEELLDKLDSYTAAGITSGHLGVAWSWYLISEEWRSFWPTEHRPALDTERQKVAILMSDGEFNTYFQASNDLPDEQTEELCENMKADNVMIFSVILGDIGRSEDTLRDCASLPEYYFDADSSRELGTAFLSIAEQLKSFSAPIFTK